MRENYEMKKQSQTCNTRRGPPLQQTLVISTFFYRGFTKICRYNL